MLDIAVRRVIDPSLERIAARLVSLGLRPNTVTWWGFVVGIVGCGAIVAGQTMIGLACILLNRLADGLDGCMARIVGPSDTGGYLDIVLDLIFYSTVPVAFALQAPHNLLPAIVLVHSFMGTGGSFLAFAVISSKRGVTRDRAGKKSFFYSVGLMEGTETALFLSAFCLFPQHFGPLAYTFAALCWLTTAIRCAVAIRVFRE